jgi:hypothetical protein
MANAMGKCSTHALKGFPARFWGPQKKAGENEKSASGGQHTAVQPLLVSTFLFI